MKTICIEVGDDGSMKIGIEPAGEEAAEGGMPMGAPAGGEAGMEGEGMEESSYLTPVANEEELMVKLTELLQQAKDPGANAEADAAFEGGYSETSGAKGIKGMEGLM